jgi:hypothetical protein
MSSSVRKKSQTLAWQRSTSSTEKAMEHPRWCSLLHMGAAAAVMAAAAVVMVVADVVTAGDAPRMPAAVVAATDAGAMAVEDVATVAVAAVASASSLGVVAAVAAAVEVIGAGLTACGRGALTVTATSL